MIDVPVRVKDALRSGDYKKECKISIPAWPDITDSYSWGSHNIGYFYFPDDPQPHYGYGSSASGSGTGGRIVVDSQCKALVFKENNPGSGYYVEVFYYGTGGYIFLPSTQIIENNTRTVIVDNPPIGEYFINYVAFFDSGVTGYWVDPATITYKVKNLINNDYLVAESVKFDERMCSDSELKFGLCEGTSVEFQYFDFPNIRGQHIVINLSIQYKDENDTLAWYEIPMGQYDVDECSRQASTGIIKAVAYNKLKSEFLDADQLANIYEYVYDGTSHSRKIVDILNYLLNGYHIEKTDWEEVECKLWHGSTDLEKFTVMDHWENIYYNDSQSITWRQYEKINGFYPYTYPTGGRWVVYAADFYYIPADADSISTSSYWKYDAIHIPEIWDIVKENLNWFYDIEDYSAIAVKEKTAEVMQSPWFGIYSGWFQEYATGIKTGNYLEEVAGFIGELETSVCGYTAPVNIGEFTTEFPVIRVPFAICVQKDDYIGIMPPLPFNNQYVWNKVKEGYEAMYEALAAVTLPRMYRKQLSSIEEQTITTSMLDRINSALTLRDLQAAVFEIDCQYGKLDRVTDLFSGIELNNGALYPRDNLYPADELFPMGTSESGYPSMYSKLWADEGNVRSFRYLIITYKGTENGQEVEKTLQRTVNANGTDNYNMSDNWLFRNIVWSDADVATYADAMVAKMRDIRWFPFEMWCAGLPYLEAGDEIEIQMKEGTYKSYVLRRTLSGIQNLQDEMINGTLDIF